MRSRWGLARGIGSCRGAAFIISGDACIALHLGCSHHIFMYLLGELCLTERDYDCDYDCWLTVAGSTAA